MSQILLILVMNFTCVDARLLIDDSIHHSYVLLIYPLKLVLSRYIV